MCGKPQKLGTYEGNTDLYMLYCYLCMLPGLQNIWTISALYIMKFKEKSRRRNALVHCTSGCTSLLNIDTLNNNNNYWIQNRQSINLNFGIFSHFFALFECKCAYRIQYWSASLQGTEMKCKNWINDSVIHILMNWLLTSLWRHLKALYKRARVLITHKHTDNAKLY